MLPRPFCAVFLTAGCVCAAFLAGCGPRSSSTNTAGIKGQTPQLTVLVIDDPALNEKARLLALARELAPGLP